MTMRSHICAALLFVAAGVPLEAWASASPPAAPAGPNAEEIKRAEASYKQGVRLYSEKKYVDAEAAFEAAWAVNPTADVAYNLGTAEYQQGKHREAAEHLSFALRSWPLLSVMAGLRPLAEQRLAESRTRVGALSVKVSVEGAEVFVDGQRMGKAPLAGEVFVEPGAHMVEAKLQGYVNAKETVQAEKGTARAVELRLMAPLPVEAKPEEKAGAGSAPGGAGGEGMTEEDGLRRTLTIAGIASSAAAITAGVVFAVVSNVKANDAAEQRAPFINEGIFDPCSMASFAERCEVHKSTIASQVLFGNLAVWSFVVGGSVGVGTAVYALMTPGSKSQASMQAAPWMGSRGGGVVIAGRW